tara:strand:+ start:2928 stop:3353 length:426 start_codon:yes stop_codon:yes gene_type:complete
MRIEEGELRQGLGQDGHILTALPYQPAEGALDGKIVFFTQYAYRVTSAIAFDRSQTLPGGYILQVEKLGKVHFIKEGVAQEVPGRGYILRTRLPSSPAIGDLVDWWDDIYLVDGIEMAQGRWRGQALNNMYGLILKKLDIL